MESAIEEFIQKIIINDWLRNHVSKGVESFKTLNGFFGYVNTAELADEQKNIFRELINNFLPIPSIQDIYGAGNVKDLVKFSGGHEAARKEGDHFVGFLNGDNLDELCKAHPNIRELIFELNEFIAELNEELEPLKKEFIASDFLSLEENDVNKINEFWLKNEDKIAELEQKTNGVLEKMKEKIAEYKTERLELESGNRR